MSLAIFLPFILVVVFILGVAAAFLHESSKDGPTLQLNKEDCE